MKSSLKRVLSILGVLILWFLGSRYSDPLFLPKPEIVFSSILTLTQNGMLVHGAIASFERITVATILSAIVSIPIGLLIVNYKIVDNMITPITGFMRFMPVTAFYPLLMMWVGIGEQMKITFLFMATFFYFLPSVILAIKEVNSDLIDTAYTIGMSKLQIMFRVLLPGALPSIAQSFLMMYGIGWTYVIIAETINANVGLGFIINIASARGATHQVFASLLVILLMSYLFDTLGNQAIKKIFKWKFSREVGN